MSLHNHFYPAINYCLYYNYIYAISPRHNSGHKVCGGPGWRRVAFIRMTDTYQLQLPYIGLNLTTYSKRTCGRSHTTREGCSSTTFSVACLQYSCVCGRIREYQFGVVEALRHSGVGINNSYVDGVSLTHRAAERRQYIWTLI